MPKRSYGEYCGLAAALDLLGERWTMLVIRELLMGPKRFTDLLNGLPGVGTGLLTQRLRELEDANIAERAVLPPPAASVVYQLTADGEQLRTPLLELTRWGMRRLGAPTSEIHVSARMLAFAVAARFNPRTSPAADGTYELRVDAEVFQFTIGDGQIELHAGQTSPPRAVITADMPTLIAINNGSVSLTEALSTGSLTVEGEAAATAQLATVFELGPIGPAAP
jgi:DNA-binding HxlR family transcriptional regulator/putative sterol carrier protein